MLASVASCSSSTRVPIGGYIGVVVVGGPAMQEQVRTEIEGWLRHRAILGVRIEGLSRGDRDENRCTERMANR